MRASAYIHATSKVLGRPGLVPRLSIRGTGGCGGGLVEAAAARLFQKAALIVPKAAAPTGSGARQPSRRAVDRGPAALHLRSGGHAVFLWALCIFASRGGEASGRGESASLVSTKSCWRRMASAAATL